MKKTYEFETEPVVEYCIKTWTPKSKWTQGSPWVGYLDLVKGLCRALLQNGAIAKIVKRTTFHENLYLDEYGEWVQKTKAEKEEPLLEKEGMQRLIKAIFEYTEEDNDQV